MGQQLLQALLHLLLRVRFEAGCLSLSVSRRS